MLITFCHPFSSFCQIQDYVRDGMAGCIPCHLTNIILKLDSDGRAQIVFYQNGVGSEADFAGKIDGSLVDIFKRRTYVAILSILVSFTCLQSKKEQL